MTSDLLFSVLPREGKVPIAHEKQKVYKIDKQGKLKPLSDQEQVLKAEEREARQQQQSQPEDHQPLDVTDEEPSNKTVDDTPDKPAKKRKGPKHLDIYV